MFSIPFSISNILIASILPLLCLSSIQGPIELTVSSAAQNIVLSKDQQVMVISFMS